MGITHRLTDDVTTVFYIFHRATPVPCQFLYFRHLDVLFKDKYEALCESLTVRLSSEKRSEAYLARLRDMFVG